MNTTRSTHPMTARVLRAGFTLLACATISAVALADEKPQSDSSEPPPKEFSPMTKSERFRNYLVNISDYEAVVRAAAAAGINQVNNTPKEWGGGAEAYGKRVGNSYAIHFMDRTFQYGISSALHEDNRYFVSQQSGFFRRTKYAVASTFLARHDDGSRSFSFSRFGGAAGSAFVSRAWQPRSTTSAGDGAVTFGVTIATAVGFNVVREFLPDMKRRFHKE